MSEWSDERLLEFLLDESAFTAAEAVEVLEDARLAARADELASFLGRCRTAFEPQRDDLRAHALTEKVLARTTREDLGWRGDLRLVTGFVVQRLRSSSMLRVAAASLLVHMVAVPSLLAYVVFFSPQEPEPLRFDWEPPAQEAFEEHDGDELEVLPGQGLGLDLDDLDDAFTHLGAHNAVQWDRYHLRAGAPEPENGAAHSVTRLLDRRARALAGESLDAEERLDALAPAGVTAALERALLAELLLDEATRTRRIAPALEQVLSALGGQRLEAAALARAEALGLLTESAGAILRDARAAAPEDELLAPGLRPGGPLGAQWREALSVTLEGLGLDDPVARRWLEWRR